MLIAQISDSHLSPEGTQTFGHVDNGAALKRVVAHVNAGARIPDMAVISGDLTNDGSLAEARHAKLILDDLTCPYLVLPGNHDDRETLRNVFGKPHCGGDVGGFLNFTHKLAQMRLIGLDSVDAGRPGGAFCKRRVQWLRQELAQSQTMPTLIFMHHPPMPLGIPETDEDGFAGVDDLGDAIAESRTVLRISAGHIHLATQSVWRGIMLTTAPSVGMELTRDFTESGTPSKFIKAAPGYLMHHLTKAGNFITHVVYLPDKSKAYPFESIR